MVFLCYFENMKKKYLILLTLLPLSLSACSLFPEGGWVINSSSASSDKKPDDLKNSFINIVDNRLHYVTLDKNTLTLIPETSYQFHLSIYDAEEEPDFSKNWEVKEWGSENESVVTIDKNGHVTAKGVGTTRIYGKVFTSVGAYCTITVIEKELDSIYITNAKKTYILGDEFTPTFTTIAKYKGGQEEIVVPTSVDASSVNMEVEGTYTINVTYTFKDVTKSASYEVKVIESPTYEAKALDYTSNDMYTDRLYGWYNPRSGNVKGLVIPIYFTDTPTYIAKLNEENPDLGLTKEKVLTDLNTAFFGEGRDDGWNSVSSYYKQVSNNQLNLTGKVSNWYEPGKASTDITGSTLNDLIKDAVNWYFTTTGESKKDYDSDNNGVIDYINIIYGRDDYDEKIDDPEMALYWGKISSNSGSIVPGEGDDPDVKFHMWAAYSDMYNNLMNTPVDAHVYTHETGHTFGLEDYYDYNNEKDARPMAGATMMFHNTHQQDPFSTLSLGWSKVIVPETSCVIELNDYQTSHQSILLSAHPEAVNSPFDEYILVELYAPNGVNKFDTEHAWRGYYSKGALEPGIRLWHVDARIAEQISEGNFELTTNPLTTRYSDYAFTNSTGENHGSIMGQDYHDYSMLFEIRNDKEISYLPDKNDKHCMFTDETLFHPGDVFTLEEYGSQFIEGTKLNNGEALPWKITVESIASEGEGYKATITLENL